MRTVEIERHVNVLIMMSIMILFGATVSLSMPARRVNGKIAFTSMRDGNAEIYAMNSDGTGQVRLTFNGVRDDFPVWSPDGRKIAYLSGNSAGHVIKTMNSDGTGVTEVTPLNFLFPDNMPWRHRTPFLSWSQDGTRIAFQDDLEIFVVNLDGSNRTNLTNRIGFDSSPAWSDDGSRIAFTSDRDEEIYAVYVMTPEGNSVWRLTENFLHDEFAEDWSPDGTQLLISYFVDAGPSISVVNVDGTIRQILNYSYPDDNAGPKWSPDGNKIVFYRCNEVTESCQVFKMDPDGSDVVQLTDARAENFHPSWQPVIRRASALADFDGDGRSDISVFRPSDAVWYLNRSTDGFASVQFGVSTDQLAPADFDGDGKTDISVFRDGVWWRINSSDSTVVVVQFGQGDDYPLPADYTGDGRAEVAVFREGHWWILDLSTGGVSATDFGLLTDQPVPADYDGDGRTDFAIFRSSSAEWWVSMSGGRVSTFQFGDQGVVPMPGDYTGDGRADVAVYKPENGTWSILRSDDSSQYSFQFGMSGDIPAAGDYDGDGKTDPTVFRPGGQWWVLRSLIGMVNVVQFGADGDVPVPGVTVR